MSSPTRRLPDWAQVLGLAKRANMVPDGTVARPGAAARSTAGSMSFWLEFVLQPLRICGLLPATLQMELLVECEEKVDGEDEWMNVQGG